MKQSDIYDEKAHSVTLLRSPFGKSRPGMAVLGRGATILYPARRLSTGNSDKALK
jgi:hypothetical protein